MVTLTTLTANCGQPTSRCSPCSVSRQHFHRSSKKFKRSPEKTVEDEALSKLSDYFSASPSCISALDYCHLSSSASNSPQSLGSSSLSSCTTNHAVDPVYLEDDQVFYNLILKESLDQKQRQSAAISRCSLADKEELFEDHREQEGEGENRQQEDAIKQVLTNTDQVLTGEMRHSLLSWMLEVCLNQYCQDDIFPLACTILDKFLLFQQPILEKDLFKISEERQFVETSQLADEKEFQCNEEELNQRQLYLFAACSLLLASKLRQTPRLLIQSLIKSSQDKLYVALERDEIQSGEILILSTLKWDLASLVTPSDFLTIIMRKCRKLIGSSKLKTTSGKRRCEADEEESGYENDFEKEEDSEHEHELKHEKHELDNDKVLAKCDEFKIREHTQKLVELCLLDSRLSQFPPSILAVATIAVAIGGMSRTETEKDKTCWRLHNIVSQIHEATHKINDLKLMIDAACEIEEYVQRIEKKMRDLAHDD